MHMSDYRALFLCEYGIKLWPGKQVHHCQVNQHKTEALVEGPPRLIRNATLMNLRQC